MVCLIWLINCIVPPNIIDAESSPSTVSVRENHNATLICKAEGTPQPTITWRREDSEKIVLKKKKKEGKKGDNFNMLHHFRLTGLDSILELIVHLTSFDGIHPWIF